MDVEDERKGAHFASFRLYGQKGGGATPFAIRIAEARKEKKRIKSSKDGQGQYSGSGLRGHNFRSSDHSPYNPSPR